MMLINGIKDMRKVIDESRTKGKWQSWVDNYYKKYKRIFDYQLQTLYMADITLFKELVEKMDFDEIADKLNSIESGVVISDINKLIKDSIKALGYNNEFEVYLLYGFGHVNGTVGHFDLPFVYYGIENFDSEHFRYVIPHEINHMVRLDTMKLNNESGTIADKTVADILINEGLGVTFPLVLEHKIDETKLRCSIGIREEQFCRLVANESDYFKKIIEISEKKVTQEIWYDWFVIDNSCAEITSGIGYFIGGRIIQSLIKCGKSIEELTKLSSHEVLEMYRHNNDI